MTETKTIDNSLKLDNLELVKHLESIESHFLPEIKHINDSIKEILSSRIPTIFPEYTLHNIEHSYRVIKYMGDLIPDISKLNELEVTMLVIVGLLHDVGMAVSKEDIELIKKDDYTHFNTKFSAVKKLIDGDDNQALQDYIRRFHAQMSGIYIREHLIEHLKISSTSTISFMEEIVAICESHTQNFDWIKLHLKTDTTKGDYEFNSQYISHLLRLGDILDIDEKRTPLNLYNLVAPKNRSNEEWKQHFIIQNYEKIVDSPKTGTKHIIFHGNCKNPHIHRKLLSYFDWVQEELTAALLSTNDMRNQYRLNIEDKIVKDIETIGYTFSDYKMKLDFKAISSLLMGEKIYGSKNLGLRELIQNSIDACRYRKELESTDKEFGADDYVPKIKITINKDSHIVSIKDNGVGMSMDVIKNHFLNIGKSYYNSEEFKLKDIAYKPIGNYGIGFLACFMLSKNIKINTRHYDSKTKYTIELELGNEYTSMLESSDLRFEGTEVIFDYQEFMNVFNNNINDVNEFLTRFFITDGIEIELIDVQCKDKYSIKNIINKDSETDKGYKIDLSQYLKEVEGYAIINLQDRFINKINQVSFEGQLFLYDDEDGIIKNTTSIDVNKYKNGDIIKYYNIPIVEESLKAEYINGLQYTNDDVEQVIDNYDNDLAWISVLPSLTSNVCKHHNELEAGDNIFENFDFDDLVSEFGHQSDCKIKIFEEKINIFEGEIHNIYLPFIIDNSSRIYRTHYSREKREVYIRNVLIKDYVYNIKTKASILDIKDVVINVKSRKIIPDISRNKLDDYIEDKLNYSINKAIHQAVLKLGKLNHLQKKTLENFIEKYYNEVTEFEK